MEDMFKNMANPLQWNAVLHQDIVFWFRVTSDRFLVHYLEWWSLPSLSKYHSIVSLKYRLALTYIHNFNLEFRLSCLQLLSGSSRDLTWLYDCILFFQVMIVKWTGRKLPAKGVQTSPSMCRRELKHWAGENLYLPSFFSPLQRCSFLPAYQRDSISHWSEGSVRQHFCSQGWMK